MTYNDLLMQKADALPSSFLKMAQYTANQCTGCSDSPMILAFKAQQVMLEAHEKGENPIDRLNSFLGTSIPEDVLLNFAN